MNEMTKEEVMIRLVNSVMNYRRAVIAVLNSSIIESDSFRSEFIKTLNEVPRWLLPELVRINASCVETDATKILFVNNYIRLKGVSLDHLCISKSHTPDQFDMTMKYVYPCIYGSKQNFTIF